MRVKIFLVHGDPKRLRTAELSNWTGKAVAGPRSEFDSVLAREESQKSGIYFLTGIDPWRPCQWINRMEEQTWQDTQRIRICITTDSKQHRRYTNPVNPVTGYMFPYL